MPNVRELATEQQQLQYGDILVHMVTPNTLSAMRLLIMTAQFFRHPTLESRSSHFSIYLGRSKMPVLPEDYTSHRVVEMLPSGIKFGYIWQNEEVCIIRPRNSKLATLVADLAVFWAKRSDTQYSSSNMLRCLMSEHVNFSETRKEVMMQNLYQKLPDKVEFTCTELVATLYHVALHLLYGACDEKKELVEKFWNAPFLTAPANLKDRLCNNQNFYLPFHLTLTEPKSTHTLQIEQLFRAEKDEDWYNEETIAKMFSQQEETVAATPTLK